MGARAASSVLHRTDPAALPALADLADTASSHHERLNGTGYHRGLRAAGLDELARILAAADAYTTLREQRPSRAAHSSAETVQRLQDEVESAALDASAVRAVITAAEEEPLAAVHWPHLLSDREVEVLRLAVRGLTIRQVGNRLGIAPKTVDRHFAELLRQDRCLQPGRRSLVRIGAWAPLTQWENSRLRGAQADWHRQSHANSSL